ncbi:unnamed protein product [Calicophoron daubneyi]|uniref:Uncharacterized protein n=1 Tax=Calicophoron daubneyi TaxID=300641 RepID=A0AAV2TI02_CALDB
MDQGSRDRSISRTHELIATPRLFRHFRLHSRASLLRSSNKKWEVYDRCNPVSNHKLHARNFYDNTTIHTARWDCTSSVLITVVTSSFVERLPRPYVRMTTAIHETSECDKVFPLNTKLLARNEVVYTLSLPTRDQNVLYCAEPNNSNTLDTDRDEEEAPKIPHFDTLVLASESVKKCLEPLRPTSGSSGRTQISFVEEGSTKYLERRRKRGYLDLKKVLHDSNSAVGTVRQGVSFFGMLNKEMITKITKFWEAKNRYEEERKLRIQPPNRRHLSSLRDTSAEHGSQSSKSTRKGTSESGSWPNSPRPVSLVDQIKADEQKAEEEEAQEDALLAMESEIFDMTSQLLSSGCPLPIDVPQTPEALSRSSTKSSSSTMVRSDSVCLTEGVPQIREPKIKTCGVRISPVVQRRRRKLRAQWLDEQPRPFTPFYFNICRPGIGKEIKVWNRPNSSRNSSANSGLYEVTEVKKQEEQLYDMPDQLSFSRTQLKEDLTGNMLYAQLCCLLWLLEQMEAEEQGVPRSSRRAISTAWKSSHPTGVSFEGISELCDLNKPESVDQNWYQLVCGFDRMYKLRVAMSQPQNLEEKQVPTTPDQRLVRSARSSKSGHTLNATDRSSNQKKTVKSAMIRSKNVIVAARRLRMSAKSMDTSSSTLSLSSSSPRSNVRSGSEEQTEDHLLENQGERSVQFTKNAEPATSPDLAHGGMNLQSTSQQTKNKIDLPEPTGLHTFSDLIGVNRSLYPLFQRNIEDQMDKESVRERMNKAETISENTALRPHSTSVMELKRKEFKSTHWATMTKVMRAQMTAMIEEKAMELQDRLEYMRQLRPQMCFAKYQSIPTKGPVHKALHRLHTKARYGEAVSKLAKKMEENRELSSWYVDLVFDLGDLAHREKIPVVLRQLESYAQAPTGHFTVLQLTRVLRSLTIWELCSPTVASAVEFVRSRIIDMTLDEYIEWLCKNRVKTMNGGSSNEYRGLFISGLMNDPERGGMIYCERQLFVTTTDSVYL